MANTIQSSETIQVIKVTKETTLGLSLIGEISRTEGSLIYVKDIIPGGDCHKDGRLRPGDQLVSINKESLVDVPCEKAKSTLNRAKLRREPFWEIAFIRPCASPHFDQTSSPEEQKQGPESQSHYITDQYPTAPPKRGTSDVPTSANYLGHSHEKKLSINPDVRFKIEKLEMALNYIGINPTEEEKQSIGKRLQMDSNGTVSYGEFVRVARSLFSLQLKDNEASHLLESVTSQVQSCDLSETNDIERLKRERKEAYAEIKRLQDQLIESASREIRLSEELKIVKQEAKASIEETRSLRSRIQLAEVAQSQARGVEMDYEEVIRLLEAEITELKAHLGDHSGPNKDNMQDFKRRVTVLDCQLRKSEMARKSFEVSTEKLLRFVEDVHEILSDSSVSAFSASERHPAFSSQTLLSRIGQNRRGVLGTLAAEAKELARSIRAVVLNDCLPYGWEEAYTADGIKYFINHVTQTTSWSHPVASALTLSCPEDSSEDILLDPSEFKSI